MKINKKTQDILFRRILVTLIILSFIRIGTFTPVPGINHIDLAFYIKNHSITKSLISTFSSSGTFVIGLFTLNIFPYLNASILIQLLIAFSPNLSKLQKQGDFASRRVINRLTRFITLLLAISQSIGIALYLKLILFDWNYMLALNIVIWLTTGAMIVLWLSEVITDYGLGNGASLLIYVNIISNFPNLIKVLFTDNPILPISLMFISFYGIIFLQNASRPVYLILPKQLNQDSFENSMMNYSYIPLRFNSAGAMPIILSTALLVIPNYVSNLGLLPKMDILMNLKGLTFFYWISYFGLILFISYIYSTIILNPKDISDQLQKMSVSIRGIRPGKPTTFYLKQTMKRVTLVGAIILATLTIGPDIIKSNLNLTNLNGLSTPSLLILANVVSDLVLEVENIYYSNIYN